MLETPSEQAREVARRARARRLAANLSQRGLADRSGVSLASLKRFESSGEISFLSLIKLAHALNATAELSLLFPQLGDAPTSLDELLSSSTVRQRGRRR